MCTAVAPIAHPYALCVYNAYACVCVCVRARACLRARVCCLLVLDSVTSTPQWTRQPESRDMHDVCVLVCKWR